MRKDWMCSSNAVHRILARVIWCEDCLRWHFKLSLQQRSAPSSARWSIVSEWQEDVSPEWREMGVALPPNWSALSELQRLHAELAAGVQRLI